MKDLMKLVAESKAELDAIGIPYRTVRNWTVNTRARSRWGQCKTISKGVFDIDISERLLSGDVPDFSAKNTIIHELLHTVEGCEGHGGKWKQLAERVNQAYPQYHIKRVTSNEEAGVQPIQKPYRAVYKIACSRCGTYTYRQKASKLVQHPERYRCAKCGGKLQVFVRQ